MNPEEQENFRLALLRVLDERASDRFGLQRKGIAAFLVQYGFRDATAPIAAELQYLEDKQLVAPVGKTISPENRSWRITAAGRDFLALNN